jgi:hypothetical protein
MILKQLLPVMLLFVFILSCNNNESKPAIDKTDSTAVKEMPVYPFTASYSLK